MISALSLLASYGFFEGGGMAGNLLSSWEQAGVFSYILPFLIIFSLVFGILVRVNIFRDNKTINGIIALAVALMALQFPMVPMFFSEIFPWLGIGLSIILVILILAGLFINPEDKGWMVGLGVVSLIIITIVVAVSLSRAGLYSGFWFRNNWPALLTIGVFLALIGAVIAGGSKKNTNWRSNSILSQSIRDALNPPK